MADNNSNNIYLSPGPHFSGSIKSNMLMLMVVISLLPECVMGVIYFGLPALITILASVASCVVFEAIFQKLIKRPVSVGDFSAVVTGVLLALTLPPTMPVWQTVLGAFFAIVVAKGLFGGLGCNVWNPALTGRAFLFVSFPTAMGSAWVTPFDAVSTATPLAKPEAYTDLWQLFTGAHAGSIGETCIIAILGSALFLLITHVIDWRAPLTMIATACLCTFLANGFDVNAVLFALTTGGLLFGATFMVTDYTTAPLTGAGRLIFGAGCGLITFLIRQYGGFPEGVMFSILIMNSLVPFLNKISRRKYGYGLKKDKASKEGAQK